MPDKEIEDLWVAEYSLSQKAIHVQTVREACSRNIEAALNNRATDYLVIGLGESHEEASRIAKSFRTRIESVSQ